MPLSGEAWSIQSVRKVFGQQETAVESHIDHISSTIICFPNMTKLAMSSQICVGFVISCRQRENDRLISYFKVVCADVLMFQLHLTRQPATCMSVPALPWCLETVCY